MAFRLCLVAWGIGMGAQAIAEDELPLNVEDGFEEGAAAWKPTDATAWKIVDSPRAGIYSLFQQSQYEPPYRSPVNYSLLDGVVVGDFELEIDLRSTVADYDHRDMCLIFGFQDASHFYYVHLGKKTDNHANQVFIVNAAPRTKISLSTTEGTDWDDEWHHVKLVRRVETGDVAVYFDDLETPVMTARDTTFANGQVGLGSFDDTGDFDNFKLRAKVVENR
jgi:hypothetical protein